MTAKTHATTPVTTTGAACARRSPAQVLMRRWPTALALALTVPDLAIGDGSRDTSGAVAAFGEALPLLPLLYLIVNQLGKPQLTWPVLGAGLATMVALRAQGAVPPSTVLVTVALILLIWGTVRGTPHGRTVFGIQTAGAFIFCALALAGLTVNPDLGRHLVAAGWLLHGVWDFVHLRLRRLDGIVSHTFAEWCGVVDVLIAVELLLLP
ncbi:hypothetical protein [Streptomyces sp. NPDC001970]